MNSIRWTARIIGTLIVLLTLVIGIGEFIEGLSRHGPGLNTYTIIIFIVWGIGLAGLVLALWKEGLGGLISLLSFILFNILAVMNTTPGSTYTPILLVFMLPSILYLDYWWEKRNNKVKSN